MNHNSTAIANSLALTTGIFFIACQALVFLFPGLMFSIAQSWAHDIKLTRLDSVGFSPSAFFLGLISSVVTAWIIGYIFVYIRNLMKS